MDKNYKVTYLVKCGEQSQLVVEPELSTNSVAMLFTSADVMVLLVEINFGD